MLDSMLIAMLPLLRAEFYNMEAIKLASNFQTSAIVGTVCLLGRKFLEAKCGFEL